MRALILLLPVACGFLLAQQPNEAERLIQGADCVGCHAVDRQIVGPGYAAIAQRYAGQSDAADKLSARIRDGGNGMTPHPNLNDAQRKTIVDWILTQKSTAAAAQGQAKQYPHTLKDGSTVNL